MATVVVTWTAQADLEQLIRTHSLPSTTLDRIRMSLEPLARFPPLGRGLEGRWTGVRVLIGPWPWMLVVYRYDQASKRVVIISIQDSRSAAAVTSVSGTLRPG